MSDLVARLRDVAGVITSDKSQNLMEDYKLAEEAADRIAKLEAALEWYASPEAWTRREVESGAGDYGRRAREALGRGE